jgi:glycosyltransferase involved in cell wall biosynthesis
MMRIALIIDAWDPIVGGGQRHVWELCSRLVQEYGYEMDIFTRALKSDEGKVYDVDEEYFNNKLHIYRSGPVTPFFNLSGRLTSQFTIMANIIRHHKDKKYDVIHAHAFLGAVIGKLAQIFTGLPLIITVHGTNLTDVGAKGFSAWLEKQICFVWRYAHIIAVGGGYAHYKNTNKKITIIPNGVDITPFDAVQKKLTGQFKILFVGRLEWTKGVDVLIDAFSILKKKYPGLLKEKKAQLHIVGYGYDSEKYKTMVRDENLTDLIVFRGKLNSQEVIKEYKSSNLYILSSRTEGDPLTVKEAWAAKLPVITTKCSPEYYMEDGVDGLLVGKDDSAALAEKIAEVLHMDTYRLESIGTHGYEKAKKLFPWEAAVQKTDEVYKDVSLK